VIPLWTLAALAGFLATRLLVTIAYDQPPGVYDHYFATYLRPTDLFWSMLQVVGAGTVIMLVHTYYGFNASGGPAGVGEAVGRAVRASLVVAITVTLAVAMAAYGVTGNFNLSG
jgi:phospholipid/cholesterol/gamma-HCH transport system permease protein